MNRIPGDARLTHQGVLGDPARHRRSLADDHGPGPDRPVYRGPRRDHVLPPENGPHLLEKLGSEDKELVWLENSYHVATLDNDADLIARGPLGLYAITEDEQEERILTNLP